MPHTPLPPLVDLRVPERERELWEAGLAQAPSVQLDPLAEADLECLAKGIYAPLEGFMDATEAQAVVQQMRLPSGAFFPWPIVLRVGEAEAKALTHLGQVKLLDGQGRLVGSMDLRAVFPVEAQGELKALFGTEDPSHPGVAAHLARGAWGLAGRVAYAPPELPFGEARWGAREAREAIASAGWQSAVGFQTRNPVHRAHEALLKAALERVDGLLLHPLVGETKGDDVPAAVRWESYEALLKGYFPQERVRLVAYPAAMRYAGPREALLHAVSRRNLGCTHFIVGRDHAGVGSYYGPYDALELVKHHANEIGIEVLGFDAAFWCKLCGAIASKRSCPHGPEHHESPSGTEVRARLRAGQKPPATFTRPEVAEVLMRAMREGTPGPAEAAPGVTLWFTGLSGAGKSTLAQALKPAMEALGRRVDLLDGDDIRQGLTKDLGFSEADRIENNRRIGYLAGVLNRNGVDAIVAAIAPYEAGRQAAKAFCPNMRVVFIDCPIDECAKRDVKGLYAKAFAGEIKGFTGVDDPYEAPQSPDLHLRTDRLSVAEGVAQLLHHLGLGPAPQVGASA